MNGLSTKVPTLQYILALHENTNILLISETHLTPSVNDAAVGIPGYRILRNDGGKASSHGVCAYVSEKLSVDNIDVSFPNVVSFRISTLDLYVCTVYRPPSYSGEQNALLLSFLLEKCVDKELILIGDFNLPTLSWSSVEHSHRGVSSTDAKFLDAFNTLGLTQWINEATFPRSGNTLDLIFTTETDRISEVEVRPPPPGCDHSSIHCQYTFDNEIETPSYSSQRTLWFKGRYDLINRNLASIDWDIEFRNLDAKEAFTSLLEMLSPLIVQYVPSSDQRRRDLVPWKTHPPTSLKRRRSEAWREYKNARAHHGRRSPITLRLLNIFQEINKELRHFALNSQVQYEKSLLSKMKENPKLFHSYLCHKKKFRSSVGPIRLPHGSTTDAPFEMAECFSAAFASVYNTDTPTDPAPHQRSEEPDRVLEDIEFGPSEVKNILLALDVNSSMGPDGLHPHLLKACADTLAYPLCKIFHLSPEEGALPPLWKLSLVIPIFKKGSHADPLNYRPICLPSVAAKCLERLIAQELLMFFTENNVLTDHQFGFRPGMCTEDQLLITYDYVSRGIDEGKIIDLVLFDFAKAFDVVCHSILLDKLRCIGVGGRLLGWLHEFLTVRNMQVTVKSTLSSPREVMSGVPQGSVLGPILFLVYINHIAANLSCQYKIFADDLKIYTCISNPDSAKSFQTDINHLHVTARSWGLRMNTKKCAALRFQRRSATLEPRPVYMLDGQQIPNESAQLDLGVLIDDQLKFHDHTRNVTRKAGGVAHSFLKGTVCRDSDFMVHIFMSHIRPILEYASTVWNTGYLQDIRRLESIQRLWTRQIKGLEGEEYATRLRVLDMYSVKGRFLRADLIKCWKIFNGKSPIKPTDLWDTSSDSRTRGHRHKIRVKRCEVDARARFFSERVVQDWNSLPDWAVASATMSEFKAALDTCLTDKLFDYLR